jgi:hypothetical protein
MPTLLRGAKLPPAAELAARARLLGSPLPMPQAVVLRGQSSEPLLNKVHIASTQRCGTAERDGLAIVLAADSFAELSPFPTQVRVGQFVRFEATLHGAVVAPDLLALDPDGHVRTIPLSRDRDGRVHATLSARAHGHTEIQLLGSLGDGPRPLLETYFSTEHATAGRVERALWPEGEVPELHEVRDLYQHINHVRTHPLTVDPRLEQIATAHAEAMVRTKRLAHDVGSGLLTARAKSLNAEALGENVAHSETLTSANQGLSRSPSHRRNRTQEEWSSMGVGVARDTDGTLWVCETFARGASP